MDGRATVQDRTSVFIFHRARFLSCLAAVCLGAQSASAATFTITPAAIGDDYRGSITLRVGGLTNGETVRVEKFIDFKTNLVVNPIDTLLQSFLLTDGHSSAIGGVTNVNRPGDLDAASGAIRARLNFERADIQHFSGYQYLFRITSPGGRFPATNAVLRITNSFNPQLVRGLVRCSGTNVPYATVALLNAQTDGRLFAGTYATTGGVFRFRPPPGTYQLVALHKGFVGSFQNPVTFVLGAGETFSNNVSIVPGTRTISGKVVDASNTNRALPGLALFLESSSNQFTLTFTDTNGLFNVAVTPDEWEVDPEADAAALLGFVTPDPSVVNTSTGNVSGLVLALQPATALIYGSLKTTNDLPLPAVEVYADSQNRDFRSVAYTDSQGTFFLGATGTNWYVSASGDELAPLGYLPPSGTNVSLVDDEAVQVQLVATPFGARLLGRVVDQNGTPVTLLRLTAGDFTGNYSTALSDLDGRFNLGVGSGTWYLRLYDDDAIERRLIWPELAFDVTPGASISNISFVVRRATNCITGTVHTPEEQAVPGIQVWANTTIGGTNYRAGVSRTDANGDYLIYVADGVWQVGVNCYEWYMPYGCPSSLSVTVAVTKATADIFLLPPPGPPRLENPSRAPNGQFRFVVHGAPGFRYVIEESDDLDFWRHYFSTNVFSPTFEILIDTSGSARFYRVRRENF